MYGSELFRWTFGDFQHYGLAKTTNLALSDADANSPTAVVPRGKLVQLDPTDMSELVYAGPTTGLLGMLLDMLSLDGVYNYEGIAKRSLGFAAADGAPDTLPKKRGITSTVRVPDVNSMAEFEGPATTAGIVDNLLATAGTGAITAATPVGALLGCFEGGLRVAQTGDVVVAEMVKADVTPMTAGNIRVRVKFVSQYARPA